MINPSDIASFIPEVTSFFLRSGSEATFTGILHRAGSQVVAYRLNGNCLAVDSCGYWYDDHCDHPYNITSVIVDPRIPASLPAPSIDTHRALVKQLDEAICDGRNQRVVVESLTAECQRLTVERDNARGDLEKAYNSRLLTCINDVKSAQGGITHATSALGQEWSDLLREIAANRNTPSDESKRAWDAGFRQACDRIAVLIEHNVGDTPEPAMMRVRDVLQQRLLRERSELTAEHQKELDALQARLADARKDADRAADERLSRCTFALTQTLHGVPLRNCDGGHEGTKWHHALMEVAGLVAQKVPTQETIQAALNEETDRQTATVFARAAQVLHGVLGGGALLGNELPPCASPFADELLRVRNMLTRLWPAQIDTLRAEGARSVLSDVNRALETAVREGKLEWSFLAAQHERSVFGGLLTKVLDIQRERDAWQETATGADAIVVETCDYGHKYGKLIGSSDGCPRCLREGHRVLRAERDAWQETAAQSTRNDEHHERMLIDIGKLFGKEAYTSDDGSVQDEVLIAKVPDLVSKLLHKWATYEQTEGRLHCLCAKQFHDGPLSWICTRPQGHEGACGAGDQ